MKRFLVIVGGVTIGVLGLLACAFVWMASEGRRLDASSRDYAAQVLDETLRHWDRTAVKAEASDELIAAVPDHKLGHLLGVFSERLGPIEAHEAPQGGSRVNVVPFQRLVTAEYVTPVKFEKASGHVALRLIQKEGRWKLLAVNVNSDALLP
jgi:hypothetical protein